MMKRAYKMLMDCRSRGVRDTIRLETLRRGIALNIGGNRETINSYLQYLTDLGWIHVSSPGLFSINWEVAHTDHHALLEKEREERGRRK